MRTACLLAAALCLPAILLFGPAAVGDSQFAYRDSAHFYYPLLWRVQRDRAEGDLPLWNPHENLGQPLAAEGAAAVFYPGQLVFLLPLSFGACYKLYVILHWLLAAAAASWAARRFRAAPVASSLAGVTYALSGAVLIQYANVIYLVGAAWLPLALAAAESMLRRRSWRAAIALAAVLAAMALGGDPQSAYHAGLAAVLYAVLLRRRQQSRAARIAPARSHRILRNRPLLLALAACLAFLLAAIQVLPTWQASRQSVRAAFHEPRSLYEIPAYIKRMTGPGEEPAGGHAAGEEPTTVAGGIARGLLGEPREGTHHDHVHQFSIPPWRLAELVWPNAEGREFPTHRRWLDHALPADDLWTPTLYLGFAPLLLAITQLRFCRRRRRPAPVRQRWLSWLLVLSLAASFGWYGLAWVVNETGYQIAGQRGVTDVGDPVGGLYWLMTVSLPGYVNFRFPAKWFTFASLAAALLAARGLDQLLRGRSRPPRIVAAASAAAAIAAAVALARGWLSDVSANPLYGPFDRDGAAFDLFAGLAQTIALCGVLYCLFSQVKPPGIEQRQCRLAGRRAAAAVVLITAAELTWANHWLVQYAPGELWRGRSPAAKRIADREAARPPSNVAPPRLYRSPPRDAWFARRWRHTASARRFQEAVAWDRATLRPRYGLLDELCVVPANSAIDAGDWHFFLSALQALDRRQSSAGAPIAAEMLACRYALIRDGEAAAAPRSLGPPFVESAALPDAAQLVSVPHALPRAWVVAQERVERLSPLADPRDPRAVERRTWRVLAPHGRLRDFRTSAVVEATESLVGKHWPSPQQPQPAPAAPAAWPGRCRIVEYSATRVVIEVEAARPALLVLADRYDPDWEAALYSIGGRDASNSGAGEGRPAPILRTNRVMRGVLLPAGSHRVVMNYRPRALSWGAVVSATAWLGLGGSLIATALLRRRKRRRTAKRDGG